MVNDTNLRNQFYQDFLRKRGIKCDCGCHNGTHLGNCALEIAWHTAMAIYDDENTVTDEQ